MTKYAVHQRVAEHNFKEGTGAEQYYSVEFSVSGSPFVYQFKIWNISLHEKCVLVKEDSDFLNHLKAGDVLDLKYYSANISHPFEYLKTEIKHIGKDDRGRFKGLYLVRLSIVNTANPN
jgi:predicted proteasome-type protease